MELSKEKKALRKKRKAERESPLGKIIKKVTTHPVTGRRQVAFDFSNCPTRTEQHTSYQTDVNYLMKKFKPDELAAYIAARNQYREEILGHDFSNEPTLQEAKNQIYYMKKAFEELPDDIKNQFNSHLDFLKFIDNPANQEKMQELGLLKKAEIKELTGENRDERGNILEQPTTTTQEAKAKAKVEAASSPPKEPSGS